MDPPCTSPTHLGSDNPIHGMETHPYTPPYSFILFDVILQPSGGAYWVPKDQEWSDAPALTGQPIPTGLR
jgi:hypothetical protein